MMGLFARLHNIEMPDKTEPKSARRSAILGLFASGFVLVHLLGLGATGLYLFLRSGTGFSDAERLLLMAVGLVGFVALGRAAVLSIKGRRATRRSTDLSQTLL